MVFTQKTETIDGPYLIGHLLPLTDAISNLQLNRVKTLLESGADPNVREENATSWPPLALAMRCMASGREANEREHNACREMMELLLARGADADIRWCDSDRPQCNERTGVTPLMYAATLGAEEFTSILLKHGADPSLRDWNGLTAEDYWGVKPNPLFSSWCLVPIVNRSPGPIPQSPINEDARLLLFEERDEPQILKELSSTTDRSIATVTDQRVCEPAALAYARYRVMEATEPKPRPIVPVAVVRAGPLYLVDDQADGGGRGVFNRSWRILAWFDPPD